MRLMGLVALVFVVMVSGCSSARLRVGPVGSGVALRTTGPGIEAALSDSNGAPLASFSLGVDLPGVLLAGWQWIGEHLPQASAYIAGNGPVPTGPVE